MARPMSRRGWCVWCTHYFILYITYVLYYYYLFSILYVIIFGVGVVWCVWVCACEPEGDASVPWRQRGVGAVRAPRWRRTSSSPSWSRSAAAAGAPPAPASSSSGRWRRTTTGEVSGAAQRLPMTFPDSDLTRLGSAWRCQGSHPCAS